MLVLTRNVGETIRIGDDIEVSIAEVRGGSVRVSIKAPREVKIFREEVYERISQANAIAAQVAADAASAIAAVTGQASSDARKVKHPIAS
jgi:carbon storage regulator